MKAKINLKSGSIFNTTISESEVQDIQSAEKLKWLTIEENGSKIVINVDDISHMIITK